MMKDICDGSFIQTSEICKQHPNTLIFGLYCDDFEIANPIGVHRKVHKVTAFYWTLLNLPIQYRSKLAAIQLLCIGKTMDLKTYKGHDKLLKDFVQAFQQLANGVTLNVGGKETVVFGKLLCTFADTPAAQSLGGFKEGVGTALKPCRTCNISKTDIKTVFTHEDCMLREHSEHLKRVSRLEQMNAEERLLWSQQWGINHRTFLFEIPEFDLTKSILHDPMHVLLEGLCKVELKKLLYTMIYNQKLFLLSS